MSEFTALDFEINISALVLAIVSDEYLTVEQSFYRIEKLKNLRKRISYQDKLDILKLREELTYKEISEIYGVKENSIGVIVSRYKKKNSIECNLSSSKH